MSSNSRKGKRMFDRYKSHGALRDGSGRIIVRDREKGKSYTLHPDGKVTATQTGEELKPEGRIAKAVKKAALRG